MTDPKTGTSAAPAPPPTGTVQAWAIDYILSTDLEHKLHPPAPPEVWEKSPPVRRLKEPGRPPELRVIARAEKTPKPGALVRPASRAQLMHTFMHHELQAAELMAWALLAFPDTPQEFREGVLRTALDEVRHLGMYARHLEALGGHIGAHPVRDWFWSRVPLCTNPISFVALIGMGLEGGNLDHSALFAQRFRAAGDEAGARVQEVVGQDEVGHVAFANQWFQEWTGGQDFDEWMSALPGPLTPFVLRGRPLNREARRLAGTTDAFLDRLEAWDPKGSGS